MLLIKCGVICLNLVNILELESGLHQDEWSLKGLRFGQTNQLEVIGHANQYSASRNKLYVVKCHECVIDKELFGEGTFRVLKGNLLSGGIPCGCSNRPDWTEAQFKIRCNRKAISMGFTFEGWAEVFRGVFTKVKISCEKHGIWQSGTICSLTNDGDGCPRCMADNTGIAKTKPDDVMIASFLATEQFPEGTLFWRSERVGYWCVSCPECECTGEATSGNLQKGNRCCMCSKARQQESYINWIINKDNQAVAIKFGIASKAYRRVLQQNNRSMYEVKNHSIYEFPDRSSCVAAERECKQILKCGVLTKEEMPDGYTETTDILNLEIIKKIYEGYGGVRLDG